jgi:penicillin-binding protein 1A
MVGRGIMACFLLGGLALVYFASQLPDIRAIDTIKKQQGITVLAADGRVVANYGDVYGSYIAYDQLPKSLVHAVIATEDRRFFEHHGVDFFGIARAMVTNIIQGRVVQGGSTVTQQVAKNVFLTPERSLQRKFQELLLAFWLEARFSKQEIMAIYLNRVYLGSGAFGVDAASRRYFNKSARELTLYESALLAGLLKAPSRYSPAANTDRAKARVNQVLLNMVDAGFLKKKEVAPTIASYTKSVAKEAEGGDVRYYTDWIVDEIPNLVGQLDADMVVTTTLDTKLQGLAQDALQNVITMQGEKKNVSQGALVAMKPDGAVQALVGGLSYAKSQYNRASQAKRQPGSSFKLFVYLAALEAGLSPQSTVLDAPITLQVGNKIWSPDNFEVGGYRGEIPMVEAIRFSLNTVSVRLSQYTGVSRVAEMAMRLGVPNIPVRPSIALGAVEATLLEMTGAYAHMPNAGKKVVPYGILSIRTRDGKEIYKREKTEPETVLAKGTVDMMNYMLLDVAARGTGTKAALPGRQVAGKTGTSQDYKDAWFVGYTAQMVTGVWVGNDDNKSMRRITGGTIPAVVWHEFMTRAMEGIPAKGIPSSAGSSEGLLPWLFGGEGANEPTTETPTPADTVSGEATVPADAPFQRPAAQGTRDAVRDDGIVIDNSIPVDMPASSALPAEAAPSGDPDVLTPEFWDKLADKVPENPEKGKVEHSYPGGNSQRR